MEQECPICLEPKLCQMLVCQDFFCDSCIKDILQHGEPCPVCQKTSPMMVEFTDRPPIELDIPELEEYQTPKVGSARIEVQIQKYYQRVREQEKEVKDYLKAREKYTLARKRIYDAAAKGQITKFKLCPPTPPRVEQKYIMNNNQIVINRMEGIVCKTTLEEFHLSTEQILSMTDRRIRSPFPVPNKQLLRLGTLDIKQTLFREPGAKSISYRNLIAFYTHKYMDVYEVVLGSSLKLKGRLIGQWTGSCFLTDQYILETDGYFVRVTSLNTQEIVFITEFIAVILHVAEIDGKIYFQYISKDKIRFACIK